MDQRKNAKVTRMQIVPHLPDHFRKFLEIPPEHHSIGFLACDYEDILYLAMDDAAKKADIKIIYENQAHCGRMNPWANQRGIAVGIMTGPKVADVKNGLSYAKDFIEHRSQYICFNDDETQYCYAHLIPRAGVYYQERYHISPETAVAHLAAPPVAATYALDKALKAGNTSIAHLSEIPTKTNQGGAVLYGTESDCQASIKAFIQAVHHCYDHPLELD